MQCVSIDILNFLVAVTIPHRSLERHKTIVSFGSDLIIFHNENVTYIQWNTRDSFVSGFISVSTLIVGRYSIHGSIIHFWTSRPIFSRIFHKESRGQSLLSFQYNKNNIPLWTKKGQFSLLPIMKDWSFINSGFLSCDTDPTSAPDPPGFTINWLISM